MASNTLAQRQFLVWLKNNDPFLYRTAIKAAEIRAGKTNPLDGLGFDWGSIASSVGTTFNNVAKSIGDLAPTYLQYKQQKDVIKMQLKRAEQGLPPANVEDYSPVVRIAPQITPETEAAISRVATQSVKQAGNKMIYPIIGVGVLALILLVKKRGR